MKHPYRTAALAGAVLVSLGLSTAAFAGGRPDLVIAGLKAGRGHEADQLLVKFRDGSTAAQQDGVSRGLGAQKLDVVRGGNGKQGELALLRLPAGRDLAATISALSSNPAVEYAEPNWTYQHNATSNDTYAANGSLWGM